MQQTSNIVLTQTTTTKPISQNTQATKASTEFAKHSVEAVALQLHASVLAHLHELGTKQLGVGLGQMCQKDAVGIGAFEHYVWSLGARATASRTAEAHDRLRLAVYGQKAGGFVPRHAPHAKIGANQLDVLGSEQGYHTQHSP